MIAFDDALSKVLANASPLGTTSADLEDLLGHFLAEPVVAPADLPLFDNSAVDGFGVLIADIKRATETAPVRLELAGTIQAGDPGSLTVSTGKALKILTGAPVPAGVEAVVMREYCAEKDGYVSIKSPVAPGENIRRRGAEFLKGTTILPAGLPVSPPVVGLVATLGYSSFAVYRKPRVAILVTGNELVRPGQKLAPGQIYDSNSYALKAALKSMSITDCKTYQVPDDRDATRSSLSEALKYADVVISSGGVSVGDYDYVKEIAEEIGVATIFWRIALKPGKPVYFGSQDSGPAKKLVFGLPGNPVSVLVTFHQLVKPALIKMMGGNPAALELQASLTRGLHKRPGRLEFIRAVLSSDSGILSAAPATGQDSHMMGGLAQSNCLIRFPSEAEVLTEGSPVVIDLLNWHD